jgi:spore maturation protein CgeB
MSLRLRFFAHSWRSDWNHGNAHFLRGLVDELSRLGHNVRCYEAENAWSYANLLREPSGSASLEQFRTAFPNLDFQTYPEAEFPQLAEAELRDADVVVVHEWNSPEVVSAIQSLKQRYGFRVLLHDTHHRAYTDPQQIAKLNVSDFDGVLAFGEAIRRIYLDAFDAQRAWTFHEAADTTRFTPRFATTSNEINWIGNWGDEERTRELQEFLIEPLSSIANKHAAVYGVRYPSRAKAQLQSAGIEYRGYLPNLSAPAVYSRCALTLHIPRRFYANGLSGIPTIRMFEALACGVPVVCSPWSDQENLFRPNQDFICVSDGRAMRAEIAHLIRDHTAREQISASALETIQQRHTCRHRAIQFEEICKELGK